MKERDWNLSDDDRRVLLQRLALIFLLSPLTLFVPRVAAAVLRPDRYVDSWQRLAWGVLTPSGWLLLAWTALPYLIVGFVGLTFLHIAPDPHRAQRRRWALIASLAAVLALGLFIHVPQTIAGMNFGVAFFPFYAAPFAMGGYGLGYLLALSLGRPLIPVQRS